MATLSKDGTDGWNARAVAVRDARHTHNGPSEPAHRSKKDRKRWCRGKPGVAHAIIVSLNRREFFPRLVRHCSECGKEFGSYAGQWGKPPEWATEQDLKALERAKQEPHRPIVRRT